MKPYSFNGLWTLRDNITLPKTNSSPLQISWAPKGNFLLFQLPSIFRCELAVSFREGNPRDPQYRYSSWALLGQVIQSMSFFGMVSEWVKTWPVVQKARAMLVTSNFGGYRFGHVAWITWVVVFIANIPGCQMMRYARYDWTSRKCSLILSCKWGRFGVPTNSL